VTIADVARLAGVGRGTVSRVLNERANVDPVTRARVLAAIADLDFVPSPTARRLSLGRTQTVAVILPYLTRASTVERLRGIGGSLTSAAYETLASAIFPERNAWMG
jgi:DNA-binding LacI/PurR family transcriptional regulator